MFWCDVFLSLAELQAQSASFNAMITTICLPPTSSQNDSDGSQVKTTEVQFKKKQERYQWNSEVTLRQFDTASENDPLILDLPIEGGDFL